MFFLEKIEKEEKRKLIILVLLIICASAFFNMKFITGFYKRLLFYPILVVIYCYIILKKTSNKSNKNFKKIWLLLAMTTFSASIPCYIYHEQSILSSIKATIPYGAVAIVYWYLHAIKPKEKTIFRLFFIISLFLFIILTVQQLFPNIALFGVSIGEYTNESIVVYQRNGLYRYLLFNTTFILPILYFSVIDLLKSITLKKISLCLMLICILYLFLNRQTMLAFAIGLIIGIVFYKLHVNKVIFISICVICVGILLIYFNVLFDDLIQLSQNQLEDEDYIRYTAADLFWSQSIKSPVLFLMGNGTPGNGSSYGYYIEKLIEAGLYSQDVGFIGAGYKFGYVHVILYYIIVYEILILYRKKIPPYIKMSVIAMISISIMIFPVWNTLDWVFWSMLLYMCDLHINNSNLCCVKS